MIPRWMMQLPGLRVYAALEKSDQTLVAAKKQLKKAKADLEAARARANIAGSTLSGPLAVARLKSGADRVGHSARRHPSQKHAAVSCWKPFPHVVIENLVDPAVLDKVLAEFSTSDRTTWHHTENSRERKYSTEDEQQFGPSTRGH